MIKHIHRLVIASLFFIFLLPEHAQSSSKIPEIDEIINKDGDEIWIIEDNSLPIIAIKIAFKNAGSSYDSEEKMGLAYMLSNMLNEGAGEYDDLEFKKQLENLAIHLDFSVDKDNFYITLKTLSKNRDKAFELLGLTLTSPRLSADTAKRVKTQIVDYLTKKMQNPKYVADIEWNKQFFGDHQYSQPLMGAPETIKEIRRRDLLSFMQDKFTRSNMVIGIVGDVNKEEAEKLISKHLYTLPKNALNVDTLSHHNLISDFNTPITKSFKKIEKPIPQSVIVFGFKGIPYKDKDFYSLYLLNHILGGGDFESRLMNELREERGLVYSVYTYISNFTYSSTIKGYAGTRTESVNRSLDEITKQIEKIKKQGVTQAELDAAKNYLTGSFFLRMDTNQSLANFLTFIQLERLGKDFLKKRNDMINKITLSDVNKVAERLMDSNKMVTVIVGESDYKGDSL